VILLLLVLVATVCAVAGLVGLWRRRDPVLLTTSIIGLAVIGLCAFTADVWFDWVGFNRGDGQVFIGFYLIGIGAFGIAALAVAATPLVLALRSKSRGGEQA